MNKIIIFVLTFLMLGLMTSCKSDKTVKATVSEAKETVKTTATTSGQSFDIKIGEVKWTGSKIAGTHTGRINISEGTIKMDKGKAVGGSFTMDMNSLFCTDLKAGEGKEDLEGHLKSPEFFDVAKYPTAKYRITKVAGLTGQKGFNSMVYGNLTMKDVTKEVGFKANISQQGKMVKADAAEFTINRTDFGIKYGSATFFDNLKDKAINDEIKISLAFNAE